MLLQLRPQPGQLWINHGLILRLLSVQPDPVPEGGKPTDAVVGAPVPPFNGGSVASSGSLPIGTPKVKKAILKQMEAAKDLDVLQIAFDEHGLYTWPEVDAAEFHGLFGKRRAEIQGGGNGVA